MWYTEERDLLGFFFQTTFVWTPLAFLLAFAPLDNYFSCISKYSNIPWGFHNIGRLLLIILLLAHAIADFTVGAMWNSQNRFYWVTPSIRIVMFVSIYSKINIDCKIVYLKSFRLLHCVSLCCIANVGLPRPV